MTTSGFTFNMETTCSAKSPTTGEKNERDELANRTDLQTKHKK